MGTPYLGEIKIISWNFAPQGWAFCNGQFLPINQNQALFSILGTTYGGNGQTTFALPDLRFKDVIGTDGSNPVGTVRGQDYVYLSSADIPSLNFSGDGGANFLYGGDSPDIIYGLAGTDT